MQTSERVVRGIPYELLKEYLQELGGTLVEPNLIVGAGWRVRLERLERFRLGSLAVGQTRLIVELEEAVAEDFERRFFKKTLRAGG